MSSRDIRKRLRRRNTQSLRRTCLHNPIRILIRPELKVRSAFARLIDLPHHPRNLEPVEDINVLADYACLIRPRRTKFFEQHEFLGGLRVLESDGCFVAPFGYATVRVDVDEVEGCACPVLGDVGVWEFVAAT
jgi:hypothetical protein